MRKKGQVCVLFESRPPGTHYRPGAWSWVPHIEAEEYIQEGFGEEFDPYWMEGEVTPSTQQTRTILPQNPLPEDMPGRKALFAAGYSTPEQVRDIPDWDEVKGIGQVTESELEEYFNGKQ